MDPTPPVTISPGAIDNSLEPSSIYEDSSSIEDASYTAYLVLRFPDGDWLMRMPSVVIGRDIRLKNALDERDTGEAGGGIDQSPGAFQESDIAPSVTSDDSGDDSDNEEHSGGLRFKYSHCGGYRVHLPGEPVKIENSYEAFLPVHPPVDKDSRLMDRFSAISKRHARIKVGPDGAHIECLGRNGLFVGGSLIQNGDRVLLEDGTIVQIGGLEFTVDLDHTKHFVEGPPDDDEDSELSEGSESADEALEVEMMEADSDGSQQEASEEPSAASPLDESAEAKQTIKLSKPKSSKPSLSVASLHKKGPGESEEELRARLQSMLPPGSKIEKRKGPGRPPANGLMSKRQLSELLKKQKQQDEIDANGGSSESARATTNADGDDEATAKAKGKKRKRSESAADGKGVDGERKKVEEPPRSPSPTEDQFTPAQLEKPDLTYALMIYRILKDVQPTQLNLQQLYKEVKNRWPYYRFKKDTTGWESSVRHTIKQHYFKQGERDGKGYRYTVNSEVEPPTQKSKPAPTAAQPAAYGNGQYARVPPYPHYSNSGAYRPPFTAQAPYQYQMQSPRPPLNGNTHTVQYPAQYNQSPNQAPRAPVGQSTPTGNGQAGPASGGQASAPRFNNSQAPMSAQQFQTPRATQPPLAGTPQSSGQPQNVSVTAATGSPAPVLQNPTGATPALNSSTASSVTPQAAFSQQRAFQPPNSASPAPGPPRNMTPTNPSNLQQGSRHPEQSHAPSESNPSAAASPALRPLPSEEIKNGRVPQVLTDFINNMKKMCKDLPPSTVNESVMRAEDAISWVMKNHNGDPKQEPGKSHLWRHLVGLVQETISVHDRQERARRGEPTAPPMAAAGQSTAASASGGTVPTTPSTPSRPQSTAPAQATQPQPPPVSTPAPVSVPSEQPPVQSPAPTSEPATATATE